jgi:hypothetical protein
VITTRHEFVGWRALPGALSLHRKLGISLSFRLNRRALATLPCPPPTPKILGRLVEIIYEDDKTNPDAAANATRKLRMH